MKLGRVKRGWVLIPTSDFYVMVIAKNWQLLSEHFLLTTPPWEIIKYCIDKLLTYRTAEKLGIPVPETFCPVTLKQLRALADQLDFKKKSWILKSRSKVLFPQSRDYLFFDAKALEINTKRDLLRLYTENQKRIRDFVLIQEKIPGMPDNNINVRAILNRDLKPIVICTDQKIRQYPLFFGVGTYRESVLAPKVAKLGLEFLKAIKFFGMAYVEFKKDPRDGEFKLIEVNPRLGMGVSLTKACGVDLTYNMYNLARGIQIKPCLKFKTGIRWINARLDLKTILTNNTLLPLRKTIGDVISNTPRTKAFAHSRVGRPLRPQRCHAQTHWRAL